MKEMKGWVAPIAWFHGMLFVPGLQEVVDSAQPLMPFGKVPVRPMVSRPFNELSLRSRPATAFGCAKAAPAESAMTAAATARVRAKFKGEPPSGELKLGSGGERS